MDERFRLADMVNVAVLRCGSDHCCSFTKWQRCVLILNLQIGRVADAAVQTDDGFDEELLREIERDIAGQAPGVAVLEPGEELIADENDENNDADDVDDGVADDIAAANAFAEAADSAFAYAAAAFTELRFDDDNNNNDDEDDDDENDDDDDDDDDDEEDDDYDEEEQEDHDHERPSATQPNHPSANVTPPSSSNHSDAFFNEDAAAATRAAAAVTMGHLQQFPDAAGGREWEGLSDNDDAESISAHVAAADETDALLPGGSGGRDEECERLVRLVNAAGGGDADAIDELIEALEVI
jgi:hypothetical protein